MDAGEDVPFVSAVCRGKAQQKADERALREPRATGSNSWAWSLVHTGGIIYSHVDHNLSEINSCDVQLEPQQVSDVGRGRMKKKSRCGLIRCALWNEAV